MGCGIITQFFPLPWGKKRVVRTPCTEGQTLRSFPADTSRASPLPCCFLIALRLDKKASLHVLASVASPSWVDGRRRASALFSTARARGRARNRNCSVIGGPAAGGKGGMRTAEDRERRGDFQTTCGRHAVSRSPEPL